MVEALLESLPSLAVDSQIVEAALGGPMKASLSALVRSFFPTQLEMIANRMHRNHWEDK